MKLSINLSILALFLFVLSSCTKEEAAKTKTDLISQKAWTIQKFELKEGSDAWVDEFPTFNACSKDDRYVFKADNTYEFNEGPTKCDPSDPQIYATGSWSFASNETKLLIDGEEYTIVSLTETNLIVSVQETIDGILFQQRVTFKNN